MNRFLHIIALSIVLVVSTGCPKDDTGNDEIVDVDGDSYAEDVDCNDRDAAIHPDADETCNGLDDNCDGVVDEDSAVDATTWYIDHDHDGYGHNTATGIESCDQPSGYVDNGDDCHDTMSSIHPGAAEICNGEDDDCDELVDEDVTTTFYTDDDGDGFGDASQASQACQAPSGYTTDSTDCNDADPCVNPGTAEVCDELDNDCDGEIDNGVTTTFYADADGDSYGDASQAFPACQASTGYTADSTDCDDANSGINPGVSERCNGYDDNCDGTTDEDGSEGAGIYYADADGDTYGDASTMRNSCECPSGYVSDATDCDDTDASVNPTNIWFADLDGDSYGNSSSGRTASCTQPTGYVADFSDCDDSDPETYPGADEYCDGADNNCDSTVDEDSAVDVQTWYVDADTDGYGDDSTAMTACEAGMEFVLIGGDCDDTDPEYNPGAVESDCSDPNDYNCDGSTGYTDSDGDGYAACEECNDTDVSTYPDADEYCDGVDNNCDGEIDEDSAVDVSTWYFDADADGYGDASQAHEACVAPAAHVAPNTDCDDSMAAVNPDASEICNGMDDDCDGRIDIDPPLLGDAWFVDADADGYGSESTVPMFSCFALSGYADNDEDCDDSDTAVFPGADEYCDSVDNDCDGSTDEDDALDVSTWYADADSDGYGDASQAHEACVAPAAHVAPNTDCDDTDSSAFPGAAEYCDGVDHDCDGAVNEDSSSDATTWYFDADSDGYGDASQAHVACVAPAAHVAPDTDCDDSDATVNPAADEYCDEVDNDCDGTVDEDDAIDVTTWYADADSDGYGDASQASQACQAPTGYTSVDGDCDDSDPAYHPGASENRGCSDLNDYNCDGSIGTDDLDSDGFMACLECDDTDATINPDATEYCDGIDNNCDGTVDEDTAADATVWYLDADSDGYGDASQAHVACVAPAAHVAPDTDCDDSDTAINPSATETCNGLDDDCDGTADEGLGGSTWYADLDEDGYGDDTTAFIACDPSYSSYSSYSSTTGDCDDLDDEVHPGADEYCDGVDTDCDGILDEDDALDADLWYADADGDGYGDASQTSEACQAPTGYVADDTDCDDTSALAYTGAVEVCGDGVDNDCEGTVDTIYEDELVVGDLVITEILSWSSSSWLEVWNGTGCNVDIDGLTVVANSGSYTVSTSWVLPDEGLVVFGASSSSFVDIVSSLTLNSAYDLISVSSASLLIDEVEHWNGMYGWPYISGLYSINLNSSYFDASQNDSGNFWCRSTGLLPDGSGYGTPGSDNISCP